MSAVDASEPRRREMNEMNRGRSNAPSTLPALPLLTSLAKGVTREARSGASDSYTPASLWASAR